MKSSGAGGGKHAAVDRCRDSNRDGTPCRDNKTEFCPVDRAFRRRRIQKVLATRFRQAGRSSQPWLEATIPLGVFLELSNSDVAELHESGKAPSFAAVRPLKADGTRFFPRQLSRVCRVVGDVADLRSVQRHLETRALEGDLDMVPILLLAEIGEFLVPRVEPEDVSPDGFRMHTVDNDADELSGLTTPEVHLITGPQRHAAVVRACSTLSAASVVLRNLKFSAHFSASIVN
jgi:hypothetical protein